MRVLFRCFGCISILLMVVLCGLSEAEPIEIGAAQLALIMPDSSNTDPAIGSRILIRFDLPDEFDTTRVRYAWIQFDALFPVEGQDSTLTFRVYPLTADWMPESVGWSVPWDSAGGDFIDSLGQLYFLKSGREGLNKIDVTEICRLYASAELPNNGFIIVPEHIDRSAYRLISQLPRRFADTLRLVIE